MQNLSKTTEDLSQTCDEVTRTLADLSKASASSLATPNRACSGAGASSAPKIESEECGGYRQKEKLIEEIIDQLLIASQKFQKAIKDHELSVRSKQSNGIRPHEAGKREYEDDAAETDDETFVDRREANCARGPLKYAKDWANVSSAATAAAIGTVSDSQSPLDTSAESLPASLNVSVPATSPNLRLNQRARHPTTSQKTADSLPRSFRINVEEVVEEEEEEEEDEWRRRRRRRRRGANRPRTIAASNNEPTRTSDDGVGVSKRYENERRQRQSQPQSMSSTSFLGLASRTKTTTTTQLRLPSRSVCSLNTTNAHPECKFYRTSVVRMTLKKMARTVAAKFLAGHHRGGGERFYKIERTDANATATSNRHSSSGDLRCERATAVSSSNVVPTYKQGSTALGARIANGNDVSADYADPKALVPAITPSGKAPSAPSLGPYSDVVTASGAGAVGETDDDVARTSDEDGRGKSVSDCSADSFYERRFERAETEFENAVRETTILDDDSFETTSVREVGESFRRYSRINVSISVHKLIKIPPPVPLKPTISQNSAARFQSRRETGPISRSKNTFSSFATTETETSVPTRGWVKQIVDRFQTSDLDKL